jgi:hypothetical protein
VLESLRQASNRTLSALRNNLSFSTANGDRTAGAGRNRVAPKPASEKQEVKEECVPDSLKWMKVSWVIAAGLSAEWSFVLAGETFGSSE